MRASSCSSNAFCASLAPETRAALCAHCRICTVKAGSFSLYESFSREACLVLKGLVVVNPSNEGEGLDGVDSIPRFMLGGPGRVHGVDIASGESRIDSGQQYFYDAVEHLTDCEMAVFDHDVIRRLAENDREFHTALCLNVAAMMNDCVIFCGVLHTADLTLRTERLLTLLIHYGTCLSQAKLARVLGCDRASVSRAMARIKEDSPHLWETYRTLDA